MVCKAIEGMATLLRATAQRTIIENLIRLFAAI
jgi:hypothetical protein